MARQRAAVTRWTATAATVTVTVLVGSAGLTGAGIASAAPAKCAPVFNLFIPGTWETDQTADPNQPVGMLAPIAEALETKNSGRVQNYTLPYMARAFDNGRTYADSKKDAISRAETVLRSYREQCSTAKFTITGYSQGADAAGDLASAIGNGRGPVPAESVLAVGLLADPGSGTSGSATVGPRSAGEGIGDPRPDGMGALSGRVASICDPGDMYCSIDKQDNPLLGSLGTILSKARMTGDSDSPDTSTSEVQSLASALTSDFSDVDLGNLSTDVSSVVDQVQSGKIDPKALSGTVTRLVRTLEPLSDLVTSGAAETATTTELAAAAPGSPQESAARVLTSAQEADLRGALRSASTLAEKTAQVTSSQNGDLRVDDLAGLADVALTLGQQLAPLAGLPADQLSHAQGVLSVLKPTLVVDQALNVVSNVVALDLNGILTNLRVLPERVAALDVHGAHQVAGELNNQFSPLVKMAAAVDLRWVSQVLAVIPDPSGTAQIASLVCSILSNVDVIRLANMVGQIQEVGWSVLESGNPAAAAELLPLGLELADVAVDALTGKASKTSLELLGVQVTPGVSAISTQAKNMDLAALANSVTRMASSDSAQSLAMLVEEGLSAATFFTSGAHQRYNDLVVDNAGRDAITWLADWLNLQIERAV